MPHLAGSIQTGPDEFATFVVFRFMRWISKRLPYGRVLVNDEGDFSPTWYLECVQGRFWLDERSAASDDLPPFGKLLDKVCARWMMDRGSGFRYDDRFLKINARAYADREPIKRLALSKEDLSTMTVEDVAGLIIFPWQRL
ncbi:MAG: hypothetical protein JNK05_11710 [Myxococcales bacterium]|nr:hypothetical protein [Myxococcales bacterium]